MRNQYREQDGTEKLKSVLLELKPGQSVLEIGYKGLGYGSGIASQGEEKVMGDFGTYLVYKSHDETALTLEENNEETITILFSQIYFLQIEDTSPQNIARILRNIRSHFTGSLFKPES